MVVPEAEDLSWSNSGEYDITEVDGRDVGTPDDWVPRHKELVRLTGAPTFPSLVAMW